MLSLVVFLRRASRPSLQSRLPIRTSRGIVS